MAEYLIQSETLTAIGDEVRELSGTTSAMSTDAMVNNLGEVNTEIATQADLIAQIATALEGKTAGGNGGITLPTLSNPASNLDIISGKEAIDAEGNIITGNIPVKGATTYTPTTTDQTIAAGTYLAGVQIIKGDANLKAENIVSGKTIFGVTGTAASDSAGGSDGEGSSNLELDYFAIRIAEQLTDTNFVTLYPFEPGTTWDTYLNSYLVPCILDADSYNAYQTLEYREDMGIYYNYYNTSMYAIDYRRLDCNLTDPIISFDDGHIY